MQPKTNKKNLTLSSKVVKESSELLQKWRR